MRVFAIACVALLPLCTTPVPAQRGQTWGHVSLSNELPGDTEGVDFKPYASRLIRIVRTNWYGLIPEEVRPPRMKSGSVAVEIAILQDGKVSTMKVAQSSGDTELDRAALGAISASSPFPKLPAQFHGPSLTLRFNFRYNPPDGVSK